MRRILRIVSYVVASICFIWGALYLVAAYLAQTQLEVPFDTADYLAIAFWTGLFFTLGILFIFFLYRQEQVSIEPPVVTARKQTKPQEKRPSPQRSTPTREQTKPSTNNKSLEHLKIQLTLGEITKEEFERKKKEITK